jgi:hypothetical protein
MDSVIPPFGSLPHSARLSKILVASASCELCKLFIKVAERLHDSADADLELVRYGAAPQLGHTGLRILSLCLDVGQCLQPLLCAVQPLLTTCLE